MLATGKPEAELKTAAESRSAAKKTDSAATAAPPVALADTEPVKRPRPLSAPVSAGSPRQACENRILLGFQICMAEQCARRAFTSHPLCVERRAMEERRRDFEQSR